MAAAPAPDWHVAEPPMRHWARPLAVVDCSVLSALVFEESNRDQAAALLAGRLLAAPWLLQTEIVSVALKKHLLGHQAVAESGLAAMDGLDIAFNHVAHGGNLELALRYKLSAYDAAYLWLAAELKCPLVTFDAKLATAAREHLGSLP